MSLLGDMIVAGINYTVECEIVIEFFILMMG